MLSQLKPNSLHENRGGSTVLKSIDQTTKDLFREDFEKGLDYFVSNQPVSTNVSQFLREMAVYFSQFKISQGNLYVILLNIIAKKSKNTLLVTTNYDVLIEGAAACVGRPVKYSNIPVEEGRTALLKIHGSCNFLPDLARDNISIRGVSIKTDITKNPYVECPMKVASSPNEIIQFCESEDVLAPAIALYTPKKSVQFCRKAINDLKKKWRISVSKADRIILIGLRVHPIDTHIWNRLAKSKANKYYIGGEPEEFYDWVKVNRVKGTCVDLGKTFQQGIPELKKLFR